MKVKEVCPFQKIYLKPDSSWFTSQYIIHKPTPIPKWLSRYVEIVTGGPIILDEWVVPKPNDVWTLYLVADRIHIYGRDSQRVGIQRCFVEFFQKLVPALDTQKLYGDGDPYQFMDSHQELLISVMSYRLKDQYR